MLKSSGWYMRRTIFIAFFLLTGLAFVARSASPTYVGVDKCRICHNKQYKVWESSKHAKAFDSLKPEEQKQEKCFKCHTTGPGAKLKGVQCEACHGPGSGYKTITIMKDRAKAIAAGLVIPNEETCKKCHNAESPNFKAFDFKSQWEKIRHGK